MNVGLEIARWGLYGSLAFLGACQTATEINQTTKNGVTTYKTGETYRDDPVPKAVTGYIGETGLGKCLDKAASKNGNPNNLSFCKEYPDSAIVNTNKGNCHEIHVIRRSDGTTECPSYSTPKIPKNP